jgi:hypothetical protein
VTLESIFGIELDWLEVLDVFGLEKHISDNTFLFMALEWVTSKNNTLQDNFKRIRWHHYTGGGDYVWTTRLDRGFSETENFARSENDWAYNSCYCRYITTHEP